MKPSRITWSQTRARLAQDRQRLLPLLSQGGARKPRLLILSPPYLCVWLHRISHYFFRRGWQRMARAFWQLNLVLTGADIQPRSDLGGGLLVPTPPGVAVVANAGRNLTLMALTGAGGLLPKQQDIGAGPGHAVLGDDVYLAPHAGIGGPVRVGNRVHIGPGCMVTKDVPDDTILESLPTRFRRKQTPA